MSRRFENYPDPRDPNYVKSRFVRAAIAYSDVVLSILPTGDPEALMQEQWEHTRQLHERVDSMLNRIHDTLEP
jgi:hypothetical protein